MGIRDRIKKSINTEMAKRKEMKNIRQAQEKKEHIKFEQFKVKEKYREKRRQYKEQLKRPKEAPFLSFESTGGRDTPMDDPLGMGILGAKQPQAPRQKPYKAAKKRKKQPKPWFL